MGARNALAR
jgi:hypothetical protein